MIYTVTLNPSLDYYVSCGGFETGKTNRTEREEILPGGKGINVSIMLKRMGVESVALGFVAGFTGREIIKHLADTGINTDFVELNEGNSRINIKIEDVEGTEINARGPMPDRESFDELVNKVSSLSAGDILVLSGSVPAGIPSEAYERLIMACEGKGVRYVVDAEGDLLLNALNHKPFLIKPNNYELGKIFGVEISDFASAVKYGKKLHEMGAENVIVSMAGAGAVYISEDGTVYSHGPVDGNFINGVGAGDSMIAGFLAGHITFGDFKKAFLQGISAASATAFSSGLGDEKLIKNISKKVLTDI